MMQMKCLPSHVHAQVQFRVPISQVCTSRGTGLQPTSRTAQEDLLDSGPTCLHRLGRAATYCFTVSRSRAKKPRAAASAAADPVHACVCVFMCSYCTCEYVCVQM